jgi:hypothetical protein
VNRSIATDKASNCISYRVRTVPGSSDQKKKDPQQSTTPKLKSIPENNTHPLFCSETTTLKSKLDVVNGGIPK